MAPARPDLDQGVEVDTMNTMKGGTGQPPQHNINPGGKIGEEKVNEFEDTGTGEPQARDTRRLLYRPDEAAEVMAISRSKMYTLMNKGIVPTVHLPGLKRGVRVPADGLDELVGRLREEQCGGRHTDPGASGS